MKSFPTGQVGKGNIPPYIKGGFSHLSQAEIPKANSPVRILLSEVASKALLDAGNCFVVAARGTGRDDDGRVALTPKEIRNA